MINTRWATAADRDTIVDFIDLVFSKAHQPHDFATLLPKLYGENGDSIPHHFLVEEDGKLLAAILAYPVPMRIAGEDFMTVGVGSVSVHPRARGRNFMNLLLAAVDEHAKELNAAFAVLGGNRQRYGYFGYQRAGMQQRASLMRHNAVHALRGVNTEGIELVLFTQEHVAAALAIHEAQPSFCIRRAEQLIDILRTWEQTPFAVMRGDDMIGFGAGSEIAGGRAVGELQLRDENDCAAVLRRMSDLYGNLTLVTPPYNPQRAKLLGDICESFSVAPNHDYKFYQPERIKAACKRLGSDADTFCFDGFAQPLPLFVASPDAV